MIRARTTYRKASSPSTAVSNPRWSVVGQRERVPEMSHPGGRDRQRAARLDRGVQAEVEPALPGPDPLPGNGFQHLQLGLAMGRTDMLDVPGTLARGVHDLHRTRPGRDLHRAHVGYRTTSGPRFSAQTPPTTTPTPQANDLHRRNRPEHEPNQEAAGGMGHDSMSPSGRVSPAVRTIGKWVWRYASVGLVAVSSPSRARHRRRNVAVRSRKRSAGRPSTRTIPRPARRCWCRRFVAATATPG